MLYATRYRALLAKPVLHGNTPHLHSCVSHMCVRIFALATCLLDDVVVLAADLISLPCGLCVVCVVLI